MNFTAFSDHESTSAPSILIHLESGQHPFLVLLRLYTSSFHHVMLSNVKPCNRFEFSHILSPPATSQFLHFWPVDQPFAKEVYFWSFMTKSYLSNPQNIQANVFSNFHRTVIYGKKPLKSLLIRHFSASKKIIFLEMPHFSPTLEPKKKYMQFYRP